MPPGYQRLSIVGPEAKQRVESYLGQVFPGYVDTITEALVNDAIRINLRRPKENRYIQPRDLVEFWIESLPLFYLTPLANPPSIVYLDSHVAVVSKPFGALSCPHRGKIQEPSLAGSLVQMGLVANDIGDYIAPGLAHRLDRRTSGMIAIGRTRRALAGLKKAFATRRVYKEYTAVVWGTPRESGFVNSPIARDRSRHFAFKVHKKGRSAYTSYRVVENLKEASVLKVHPRTGRTHQIRVHLASIGYPIVGDFLYGNESIHDSSAKKRAPMLLHAGGLEFSHPITGRWLQLSVPLEPLFKERLEELRTVFAESAANA